MSNSRIAGAPLGGGSSACLPISVIIPALNEEGSIGAVVRGASAAAEVIVVDGGSKDRTCLRAESAGALVVTASRGRGLQMNSGADAATNPVLLFLHADTILPPGFENEVGRLLACESSSGAGAGWGRFDLDFDQAGAVLRLVAFLINYRSRLTRIASGDQAIFARKDLFYEAGGYQERYLFEDIGLSRRLRVMAAMAVPLSRVVTSSRRWTQRGLLRTTLLMWSLKLLYLAGVPGDRLERFYYPAHSRR